MLRTALWTGGAAVALYLIWNVLQFLFGTFGDRRLHKGKKADERAN